MRHAVADGKFCLMLNLQRFNQCVLCRFVLNNFLIRLCVPLTFAVLHVCTAT